MDIALVSYEYAGAANGGGIGTYVRNAAAMLSARGHRVEVFTSGTRAESQDLADGLRLHTVPCERADFPVAILPAFSQRQECAPFDVVEGPEYGADAAAVARTFPGLPLIVKLHTPAFMIGEINNQHIDLYRKARFVLGSLRRGRLPRPYWIYNSMDDSERVHALSADEITAPSRAILEHLASRWGLRAADAAHIPYAFVPFPPLLSISPHSGEGWVTFLGRLEVRKGVIDLAHAIPIVLAVAPDVRFRLVGRSLPHPATGEDLRQHLIRILGEHVRSVEFMDGVPYDEVPSVLSEAEVCVFPSLWENFPNVCLEAMAAARGVIGSSAGGMAEIIEHGRTGLLVPPRNPKAIAEAILALLRDPERRMAMGRAARAHVLSAYASEVIGPLQEASYLRAIERAKVRCGTS